jgi:hypothetical protein
MQKDDSKTVAERGFMDGCTGAGGTETKCQCLWTRIEATVPMDELRAYGEQISAPGATPGPAPQWMMNAAQACVSVP